MKRSPDQLPRRQYSNKQLRARSIFSFLVLVILFASGVLLFNWIKKQPQDNGAARPLRKALVLNERFFSSMFDSNRRVREYPVSAAVTNVRVNGMEGLRTGVDSANWRLKVVRNAGDTLALTLDEIKALPKKDIVFEFKCIEGWSQVTHWAGVPFRTFMNAYHLDKEKAMKYIGLQTPDKQYYVGIDMPSALQEQTLLCYEMNGKPLPLNQGYPLRLIIPVKYGIKHLKRIGTLFFSDSKPPDYWAERGYDYYSGH